jgi:GAF domain-containing protein
MFEYDGELVHFRAVCGSTAKSVAEMAATGPEQAAYVALWPMAPSREFVACEAILDRDIIHVRDVSTSPRLHHAVRNLVGRSILSIPLLRDGVAIGAITLSAVETGGFTDSQVELLKTFAEQAVIAIGSVATYRALRERTAELTRSVAVLQALEDVLRAVNSSLDLEIVLATIINRAVPLAQAEEGMIYEFDTTEQVFVPKAAFGMTEDRIARLRERRIRLGETYLGRSAMERVPVHVDDVQQDASTPEARDFLQGIHAVLAVPLLRDDNVVGGLVIRRRSEGAFVPATVTLMQTFAAQCVLAIENARLFEAARRARAASDAALVDLRRAQDRLVQTKKWLRSANLPPASPTKSRTRSISSTISLLSPPNS